ncbi:MAG: His-Xaa-Ser system radical SAM maturase HxsB [Bacteroidales bacterium]|nr:His-Xaa-Ser system radical SAM maturase HxsB [Bacteroidales bacterium]MBP3254761.1 His-Xaa-Ser system radical SAM maturase HxsB [Bacteroidales bacterium]
MKRYRLLPFCFTAVADKEILTNELGDMIAAPLGTVQAIVNRKLQDGELYKSLVANFFISEQLLPPLIDVYASRLRMKKRFLDDRTSLHIFVLTLRCNQNCIYCQASSREEHSKHCSMTFEAMENSVNLMFRSPSEHLTMEFQGGEPSLEYGLIKFGIEKAEQINQTENRKITYVLCTNCRNLSDEVLDLCRTYNVLISTSLDGPAFLHNANRGKTDSYQKTIAGIEKARTVLGHERVSALMTTSQAALDYPKEIVDEYVKNKFSGIFLRALNPYGLAMQNNDWDGYTERFISFYKQALDYIIQLNLNGTFFREEYACIILRKMLTPYSTGFVDLQSPAGIVNSVLVYNYDGKVYASDESRMLAQNNDYTFALGKASDRYEDIVCGKKVLELGKIWANEVLAGCSDCAFKVYCGADPVRNHSTQGDMYGFRPDSQVCRKNKAIIEYLIYLITQKGNGVLSVFKSWLR